MDSPVSPSEVLNRAVLLTNEDNPVNKKGNVWYKTIDTFTMSAFISRVPVSL